MAVKQPDITPSECWNRPSGSLAYAACSHHPAVDLLPRQNLFEPFRIHSVHPVDISLFLYSDALDVGCAGPAHLHPKTWKMHGEGVQGGER